METLSSKSNDHMNLIAMKTKEEILAEIEIHKKTGATRRIALLEERLSELAPVDAVKNTEEDKGIAIEETQTEASGGSPLLKIEQDHEAEMQDKRDELAATLEEMKASGMSWKEIRQTTGEKAPQVLVAAWKKRKQ